MQILNTKFHIPFHDPETMVPRKALLDHMFDIQDKTLVVVQAAAGFGKTTFVTQWIASGNKQGETAWISLEKRDNSWTSFWTYVLTAFDKIDTHVCSQAKQLLETGQVAGQATGQEDLLITMINGLEKSGQRFCLVLDDFHLISDPVIHNGINFLIDHPIENLLIIIVTRTSPDLGLARLRSSGRLREINEGQLRFSRKETKDFVRGFSTHAITDKVIDTLAEQTEGWAAALKLAMLSMGEDKEFSLDSVTDKHCFLQDYLMEEVFGHLPDDIREMMSQISILDRFSLPLIRALGHGSPGQSPGHSPIDFMQRHHLFLIPLDDSGQWFRFHHLFQDFLRKELARQGTKSLALLHVDAFNWFEDQGLFEEAFSHGLKAGREDLAARVFAAHIFPLYGAGGEQFLIPFFSQLSSETIRAIPILACHYYAIKIFNGQFEAIEQMKPLVDGATIKEDRDLLTGFYMSFMGYKSFYRTGDLEDTIEKCLLALDLIPKFHGAMRQMLKSMLTLSYRLRGEIEPARIFSSPLENDSLLMSALGTMNFSLLEMEMGSLAIAKDHVQREIQKIEKTFDTNIPSLYGFVFVIMGMILKEETQMSRAETLFSKGISIIKETGFPELVIIAFGEYGVFLAEIGEFDKAHKAVDHAIATARQSFSWLETLLLAQKRYIWFRENKLELIRPWAKGIAIEKDMGVPFQDSLDYLVLARFFMEKGQWDKVFWILDPMIQADTKDLRNQRLMECLVLKAKALALSQQSAPAMECLIQALELSRNQGYIQLFLNEIQGMEDLYVPLLSRGNLPSHLAGAIENSLNSGGDLPGTKQVVIHDFREEFSTREVAILKLFQQGVSNREAADTLCLSVNTVRWYASRMFAKLSVKRRGQAVSEALRLNLI